MQKKLKESISEYHKQGLVVIPLKDKAPMQPNWQKTPYCSELSLSQFEGSISAGWVISAPYMVIDVDNHTEDALGNISWEKLNKEYNFIKSTFIVQTASGGFHHYYKIPRYIDKIANSIPDYPGIEFKGKGRQVVIPFSLLSNGKLYHSLHNLDVHTIPEAPIHLINRIAKTARKIPLVSTLGTLDSEQDIELFKHYLQHIPLIEGARNNGVYEIACKGVEYGLSSVMVIALIDGYGDITPPLDASELHHTVLSAFKNKNVDAGSKSLSETFKGNKITKNLSSQKAEEQFEALTNWEDSLVKTKNGSISHTYMGVRNCEIFLKNLEPFKGTIALNEFSHDSVWTKKAPWHRGEHSSYSPNGVALNDDDLIQIKSSLNDHAFDPPVNYVKDATRNVAIHNRFHPVKDYFNSLDKWDGVRRLSRFFPDYCSSEDTVYAQQIGVKMFTAIVARVMEPGIKFDYLPVFIGEQGMGKSTLVKTLAIHPSWYSECLGDIENKDVILTMRSKLLVEDPELKSLFNSKKNQATVKSFLSRSVDRARLAFERLTRDLPRQGLIIGTMNPQEFLHDESGNRRIWPIELKKIEDKRVREDLHKFYAEAIFLYEKGEALYMDNTEAEKLAEEKQEESFVKDEWEYEIINWINEENKKSITSTEIWEDCMKRDKMHFDRKNQKRISKIMQHMKWKRCTYRDEATGSVRRGFCK